MSASTQKITEMDFFKDRFLNFRNESDKNIVRGFISGRVITLKKKSVSLLLEKTLPKILFPTIVSYIIDHDKQNTKSKEQNTKSVATLNQILLVCYHQVLQSLMFLLQNISVRYLLSKESET